MFDIDPERFGGQIPDMAHGGFDLILTAQHFADGAGLGGRFHDHKFAHIIVFPYVFLFFVFIYPLKVTSQRVSVKSETEKKIKKTSIVLQTAKKSVFFCKPGLQKRN